MDSPASPLTWPASCLPPVFRAGCSTQDDRKFERVYCNSQLTLHLFATAAAIRIGGQTFAIQPGDLTLTPPGAEERFDFTKNGFHWFLRLTPTADGTGPQLSLPLHHRLGAQATEARRRCEAIAHDLQSAGGQADHPAAWAAAAGAQSLLCWLAALAMPRRELSPTAQGVAKAAALLAAPECATLSIAEVARRAGMSQNRLAQAFLAQHGMTMSGYRTQHLIEVAKWLMVASDLTLPAIRRRIAVNDAQRFNKLFRRVTGFSPRAWLEQQVPVTASAPLPPVAGQSDD